MRSIERNLWPSPTSTQLLMHGISFLTVSSIGTGATFSPPAVIRISVKKWMRVNLLWTHLRYHHIPFQLLYISITFTRIISTAVLNMLIDLLFKVIFCFCTVLALFGKNICNNLTTMEFLSEMDSTVIYPPTSINILKALHPIGSEGNNKNNHVTQRLSIKDVCK